ncbi:MAG: hypothetical protein UY72_C0009G0004 [Candidatus Uhrbacteria bacterium GW2011_GWD2_52_7]|uniref:Baseplate protein J-like domain-containing protein n=1 Tax=Candidatus Uhrbacteria bacterium GW2011_GWD2_52_7 TaxID=1618989 RepID=A0A0G1XHV2_9BACT|nr:MAG: hypothetical protein UY72_C0009G0004 [Candidatus Uhrbacteria bacterium GW2011_GWD2_52_7]
MSRSLKIYQRIAVAFVFATFFLLVAVLYLSISRATITITPTPKIVSIDADVKVVAAPSEAGELSGIVLNERLSASKIYVLPSEGASAVEAKASGTVTLINETNADQPLVATTRLLSEEGVLFRIDANTTVPANGQVDVIAHADKPGLSGEIGPTQFTIPGLPTSQQASIYAVSVEPMTGGVAYKRVLTEKDIADAVASLSETLLEQAKTLFAGKVDVSIFDGQTWFTEVMSQTSDQVVGAEASSFTATVTLGVTGVYYDLDAVTAYAQSELNAQVPDGYGVASADPSTMQLTVDDADPTTGTAMLSVYYEGVAVISEDSQVLDKDRFVGRSPNEVITLLKASDAIEDASVSFTPFWLQRVPNLADHIKIDIQSPEEE